jgi:hypothetical protein
MKFFLGSAFAYRSVEHGIDESMRIAASERRTDVISPLMISHFPNWRRWHTFRLEIATGTRPSGIFAIAGAAAIDSFVGEVWLCAGSQTASNKRQLPVPEIPETPDHLVYRRVGQTRPSAEA